MIREILKKGNFHLIDVREPIELEINGSIDKAINIPLGEIEEREDEVKNLKGNIIFFCRSGNRSDQATKFFELKGLKNVYNGGMFKTIQELLENV